MRVMKTIQPITVNRVCAKKAKAPGLLLSSGILLVALIAPVTASGQPRPVPWRWSSAPDHYPMVELSARMSHSLYALREVPVPPRRGMLSSSVAELRWEIRKAGLRRVVWRTRIKDAHGGPLVGAAVVISAGRIYVARYNRIASGCTLYAFSTASGKRLWKVELSGYGPVFHSQWFNRVQMGTVGTDPVVYGHEGPGTSYVEVRRASDGALLSHRKFLMTLPRPPLAEVVYSEMHRVLLGRARYRRTVTDFIRGHLLRFHSPGQAVAELRKAVGQVDGLPLQRGRFTLEARLVRKPSGGHVIEARRR